MENKRKYEDEIDLLALARKLIRYWWVYILAMVIGGGAAGAYSVYMIEPQYRAECMIYVNNGAISVGSTSLSLQDLNASQSLVDTYMVILKSRRVLMEVAKEADVGYSYETMKNMVSASKVNDTEVFSVFATSTDPKEAEKIVNLIAEILPGAIADIIEGSSVKIVDYAVIPSSKISPSNSKNAMMGAIGLLAVVGMILVLRILLDNTVQEVADIFELTKYPLLSKIPDHLNNNGRNHKRFERRKKKKSHKKSGQNSNGKQKVRYATASATEGHLSDTIGDHLPFEAREAYRLLSTNVKYSLISGGKGKIIGITSSIAAEYKTTTAINLSLSLASEKNKKVLLLDCDLRMSQIKERLKIKNKVGLTDYLTDEMDIHSIITKCEQYPELNVIIGGSTSPNPGELLCSQKMKDCFEILKEEFDYIVVDFPPANIVFDALELGKKCDGMIVVVRQNYTEKQALEEALRKLNFLSIHVLGLVFTGINIAAEKYHYRYQMSKYYGNYKESESETDSDITSEGDSKEDQEES